MTTPAVVKFDGGARPNPGPSAIGYIVETDDWTEKGSEHIGESTNNRTEYRALIQGLELASEKGCTEVEARGDSELVVKQVRGEYGVNEPELRPLRNRVQELAEEFETFEIRHIPQEGNRGADALVELVLYYVEFPYIGNTLCKSPLSSVSLVSRLQSIGSYPPLQRRIPKVFVLTIR